MAALAASLAFGLIALLAAGDHLAVVVDDVGTTTAAAVAAAACLVAARRSTARRTRRGWCLVGLACASWAAGNAVWAWYELGLDREAPFPSTADAGYLGFVPLAIAGVAFLRPAFGRVGTAKRVLDIVLMTVSTAGVGWILVLSPVAANTDGWLERGLSLAYPTGDIVMLALILSVLVVTRERIRALSVLFAGLALFAAADVAFAYTAATGQYASGSLIGWAWFTGFLAIALAARPVDAPARAGLLRAPWVGEVITHLPVLAVGALLVGQLVHGTVSAQAVGLVLTVGVLNAVRHLAANRENTALTAALAEQVAALQEEQERTHRVIDEARDPYVEMDRHGIVTVWNGPAEQVFGWTREQVVGRPIGDIVPHENRERSRERIAQFVESGDPEVWEPGTDVRYLRPDGTEVPIHVTAWHTGSGDAYRIHAFVWDISERLAEQRLLAMSERRWRSLVQHSSDVTVVLDAAGTVLNEVPNDSMLLGFEEDEFAGEHFSHLIHPADLDGVAEAFGRVVATPSGQERLRLRLRRIDGTWANVEAIATNLLDEPTVAGVVCNLRDVSDQVAAENELKRQASRDPLTGLPNRNLLTAALTRQCGGDDDGGHAALLLMDLDGFKDVNDGLGHDVGDQLLIEIGHRLDRVTRAEDLVARLGGDEFAVLLTGLGRLHEAENVAENLGRLVEEPVRLGQVTLEVGVSIGIAECAAGDEPLAVLQRADVAMYRAKRERSGFAVYGESDDEERRNSVTVAAELRSAIDHGDLTVHYQPKIELATGLVDSVEALVRWEHPTKGMLPPDEFIALAERTGLIRDLTDRVLELALQQCATWRSEGLDVPVAVNLSPRLLGQTDLVTSVRMALEAANVPAGRLTLEITESAFPENTRLLSHTLDRLGRLGVRLSVDDFGTGWSSLSKLKELPVQELKIDRSFVFALAEDATDHSIVKSILDLARSLNLTVVAEGVETEEVLDLLQHLGCPLAQGYLFSRPVPGPLLTGWMLDWERTQREARARAFDAHPSTREQRSS